MSLSLAPATRNAAREWVNENHRHLRMPPGWLFGVWVYEGERCVGVACAGRPCRMLQDGFTVEITRVCTDGSYNACSFAYGALRRAAVALGYIRVVTYTRMDEPGTSLRAAGFRDEGEAGGGEWSRPSRRRDPNDDTSPKRRWTWTVGQ